MKMTDRAPGRQYPLKGNIKKTGSGLREKSRSFIPQIEFFVEHMLLDNRLVVNDYFRPEPGLGVDNHPVAEDYPGSDNRIVFDTAAFADMGVIVDDTT
jgi:hypothetical protein